MMMPSDLLAGLPMPALLIDTSERIVFSNPQAVALLGQGINGRHFATILRQPQVIRAIEAALATREPRKAKYQAPDVAQDHVYNLTCSYVRADEHGPKGWVIVTFMDMSHVEQVGQMRRDFVANVSHELRTPLTALMGFIETLRGAARDDPAAQQRFLSIMETEASRMNRLIGDLLSLSRVESEERVRPTGQVNLNTLLLTTERALRPTSEDSGVIIKLDLPGAPVLIPGDDDQLQQIFSNLFENGVKYGGQGKSLNITLKTTPRDTALRGPAAIVTVRDFGPGIDPLHLPRLTERFYRVDNHRSRQVGGTGLGLAIVKHIVNRHRGRLRIESELGKGTVFTVTLPLQS